MEVAAVLLAAGESRRMGTPKPLLPWQGTTLIQYQIGELEASGVADIVVVLGHAAERVQPYVRSQKARLVINQEYRRGRATSVRAGVEALAPGIDAVLFLNVDQPRPRYLLEALLAAHREHPALITVPTYQGKHGHPSLFAARLLSELAQVSEVGQGLREVLRRHVQDIQEAELGSSLVLLDMNDPQEYQRAREQFERSDVQEGPEDIGKGKSPPL